MRTGSRQSLDQAAVLAEFGITSDAFVSSGCDWSDLEWIYTLHTRNQDALNTTARFIADSLRQLVQVHSLKYRVKSAGHLIAKVIRKRLENPKRVITPDNYSVQITDLIGVRALHLFKADWRPIHEFVTGSWRLREKPIAYFREGDQADVVTSFKDAGCRAKKHEAAYRSVHYLLECRPTNALAVAELQVRTVFEEGWSEIDHLIRYPHSTKDQLLNQYLTLFNRAAGIADEMGAFLQRLKSELATREAVAAQERSALQTKIDALETEIGKLKMTVAQKKRLEREISELKAAQARSSQASSSISFGNVLADTYPQVFAVGANAMVDPYPNINVLLPTKPSTVSPYMVASRRCSGCGRDLGYTAVAGDKCLSCLTSTGLSISGTF